MKRDQIEMFTTLDGLVAGDHPYRHLEGIIDIAALARPLHALYSDQGPSLAPNGRFAF